MPTEKILAGVSRFQQTFAQNRAFYERLASQGQAPEVLFITCSDSRVAPELITGSQPGELFVARSIGNVVPPYGMGETGPGAALEYAVRHLRLPHIVVCGHTDCGGIKALDQQFDWSREPNIVRWIDYARPAQTHVQALGLPAEEWHLAIVRENVLLQLENVRSYDPVRAAERHGELTLHGWVYHLETGAVEVYDPAGERWGSL